MLTALILVCSLAVTPDLATCSQQNAVDVMYAAVQSENPVMCFLHGQAYLAGTTLGRELAENERVKVVCVRQKTSAGPIERRSVVQ